VDEVEVDVVEAESLQALVELARRARVRRHELRRHEDVGARQVAAPHRRADARFVVVHRRGVDVSVSRLERPLDGPLRLASRGQLPHAEPEYRHPRAAWQLEARLIHAREL
jgi:hypothetical protein